MRSVSESAKLGNASAVISAPEEQVPRRKVEEPAHDESDWENDGALRTKQDMSRSTSTNQVLT
jgi:hypothetical protein